MNLTPYAIAWGALVIALFVVIMIRKRVAGSEDALLHVDETEVAHIARQAEVAKKLEKLDLYRNILVVLVVLTGIALAGLYVYATWQAQYTTAQ